MRRLIACVVLFLVIPAAVAARSLDREALASIEGIVRQEIGAGRLPGAVVLIGGEGGVAYRRAFGERQIEPERLPMTEDTIFDLASLTKPVATTTAIMQLVEQGRLELDAPAARYWPEFGNSGKGDRKSTRLNSSHIQKSRMPSSA